MTNITKINSRLSLSLQWNYATECSLSFGEFGYMQGLVSATIYVIFGLEPMFHLFPLFPELGGYNLVNIPWQIYER